MSAGRERSAVVLDDGRLLAWGNIRRERILPAEVLRAGLCSNRAFQVGHNRFADPRPFCLNPGLPVLQVHDGFTSSLAVTADRRAVCFRPVLIEDERRSAASAMFASVPGQTERVAAAEGASFALQADGRVWSWGPGGYGVLGRSLAVPNPTPAPVRLPNPVSSLVAGYAHMLALDAHGTVWSWGANGAGQLGVGDLCERAGPVRLMLPVRIRRIAAGHTHSFAVDEAGELGAGGPTNSANSARARLLTAASPFASTSRSGFASSMPACTSASPHRHTAMSLPWGGTDGGSSHATT